MLERLHWIVDELLGASTKRWWWTMMCGGSILSCCPHNPHKHEQALKEAYLTAMVVTLSLCRVMIA